MKKFNDFTETFFKRKFRWTFKGWDGMQEVFPESFVKIDSRPPMPIMGVDEFGNIQRTYYPTNILITQSFLMMKEYNIIKDKIEKINVGKLSLYDGIGRIAESYDLQNVKLISFRTDPIDFESNEENDELIVECELRYEKWNRSSTSFNGRTKVS